MPESVFYVVRVRPSAVPGSSWVLLDPPDGTTGATDGHTIGFLMPADDAPREVEGDLLLTPPFPERPDPPPGRLSRQPPRPRH